MTSPQRRRRRRADFNLKCSCFSKSLFASLSLSLSSLTLSVPLTVSVVSANLFGTQIRVGYSQLPRPPLLAHRTRVIVWLSSFSLSANFANLQWGGGGGELGKRVLFYELIKTLTTNSKVYMQRVSLSAPLPTPCGVRVIILCANKMQNLLRYFWGLLQLVPCCCCSVPRSVCVFIKFYV